MKKQISQIFIFTFIFCLLPFALSAQFIINWNITNATCPADTNGSISVVVSGETPPYIYHWLPDGQTSPNISGILPGNYSVTITDSNGKDSTVANQVGPNPITDNAIVSCMIDLSKTSGGTPPYGFNWSDGSTSPIINAGRGNYSVIITDANNCKASFSYEVSSQCYVSPTAFFTPNGDSYNNTWIIHGSEFFPDAKVIVFNRWGERVFEHTGLYEPWDGKSYLGIPVPDAVYYYFFYQNKNDKEKNAKYGSVTIVR